MYVINENIENEIIIKNSRFITILTKINSKEQINDIIDEIKKKYPKATHYCYAYIIDDYKKSSDDGEPGGTAGMPILNVLEKENITNILAMVIRYFGGIKLGAGGLVRAYSKSVRDTLLKTKLIELEKGIKIEINFTYEKQKQIDYILKDEIIIEKEYKEEIKYIVNIKEGLIDKLKNENYKIIENTWIEKRS